MNKPLMYLVRHGRTTDSDMNIMRGQRDSVLDKEGFLGAHELKDFFMELDWHRIFCSKMSRSIQTATIICDDQEDYQPEIIHGLEPWDVGQITGQPKNKATSTKVEYLDEHPWAQPGATEEFPGESIYQFQARVWPILAAGIQLGWEQGVPCIMVAHSSIVHSLNHLLIGYEHDDISVDPGGVIEVYFHDGEILHRPIFKEGKDDSSFQYRS